MATAAATGAGVKQLLHEIVLAVRQILIGLQSSRNGRGGEKQIQFKFVFVRCNYGMTVNENDTIYVVKCIRNPFGIYGWL